MPKFETLDSTALNEAIRSTFTEKEFRNHSFDKDCSDMILRTSMEKLSMKNLIPQAEYILRDMLEENLTSSEAVAFFLHALTERKRQNYCMMQLQLARFPSNCSIEPCDFSRVNEKIGRVFRELEKGDWIERHNNLYLYGNPGMGKTHLAIALGRRAICKGYSTRFVSAGAFFRKMQDAQRNDQLEKALKPFIQVNLLVLDDLGAMKDVDDGTFGFIMQRLMTERHHKKSTIITSNLSLADLGKTFPGASLLSSAIDRFIEDAISLQFVGDSYRRLKWKRREATINAAEDAPQTVAEDQTTPKPSEAAKP